MATAAEIQQIYQDVLGRGALSGGVNYWLGTGDSIEKIKADISRSQEAQDVKKDKIKEVYKDVLNREAKDEGVDYWAGTGDSIEKIKDDISRSSEAQGKVADLYKDLLKRDITDTGSNEFATNAADEKDASYWLGEGGLASNTKGTLGEVEANIKRSQEYKDLQTKSDNTDDKVDEALDDAFDDVDDVGTKDDDLGSDVLDAKNKTKANIDDAVSKVKTVDTSNIIDSESTSNIPSIDTSSILADIEAAQGDIQSLQGKFAGLGDQTLSQVENIIDTKYGDQLKNLSSTYKADVTDLKSQIGDLSTTTTKQYLDLESALGKASDQFGTRLDDMQTDWQSTFNAGRDALSNKITEQGSTFDKRLRDLSASMNYKMLDDNATGVQTRRSKAFQSGRTFKGTGQLGRSLRLKSLNI